MGSHGCSKCVKPPKKRERKSWEQDEAYDGIDLPDDEFDYDDFAAKELGEGKSKRTTKEKIFWWAALILIIAFVFKYIV